MDMEEFRELNESARTVVLFGDMHQIQEKMDQLPSKIGEVVKTELIEHQRNCPAGSASGSIVTIAGKAITGLGIVGIVAYEALKAWKGL